MFYRKNFIEEFIVFVMVSLIVSCILLFMLMSTMAAKFTLTEKDFVSRISKLSVDIKYESPVINDDSNVASRIVINAAGGEQDFNVKYELFDDYSIANIAYDSRIESLKKYLFDGVSNAQEIRNEIGVEGESYVLPVREYALRIDTTIYRIIYYENFVLQIEVEVGEDAYALSNSILKLLELK